MTIDRDDLLSNDLLDDEMDRLFDATAPIKKAKEVSKDTVNGVLKMFEDMGPIFFDPKDDPAHVEDIEEKLDPPTSSKFIPPVKRVSRPDMSMFKDDITRQLMANAWERIETNAGGGDLYSSPLPPEILSKINFRVAEKLPHREFMPVQAAGWTRQVIYRPPEFELSFNPSDISVAKVEQFAVEAHTYRYNSRCTNEFVQDMLHFHDDKFSATDEITKVIADELLHELNADMMNNIRQFSTSTTATTSSSEEKTITADDLMSQIMEAANQIDRINRHSSPKWTIVSPALASMLISDDKYRHHIDLKHAEKREGFADYLGDIYGMKVYIDHSLAKNELFVGKKGYDNKLDTGLSYHPFLMVDPGGVVVHPATFEPVFSFFRKDSYHVDKNVAEECFHHITFKREATEEEIQHETRANSAEHKVTPEITLIDIDVAYGPEEQLTLAAIFKKEHNP